MCNCVCFALFNRESAFIYEQPSSRTTRFAFLTRALDLLGLSLVVVGCKEIFSVFPLCICFCLSKRFCMQHTHTHTFFSIFTQANPLLLWEYSMALRFGFSINLSMLFAKMPQTQMLRQCKSETEREREESHPKHRAPKRNQDTI